MLRRPGVVAGLAANPMQHESPWQRSERLFAELLPLGVDERSRRLAEIGARDGDLRRDLERLLRGAEAVTHPLDTPLRVDLTADDADLGRIATSELERMVEAEPLLVRPGDVLGHYRVDAPLGRGGMGEVWRATDMRLGRPVALKLLPPSSMRDPLLVGRFEREARAASALNHPNILTVHDIGGHDGLRFIATELVDGETLRAVVRRGPLNVGEATRITGQILSALEAAHAEGIVHRDLKPENVMLRRDGLVKVLDFGLAKYAPSTISGPLSMQSAPTLTTGVGQVMGTARYMSPEQARGDEVDARSDLFSLGVMLHEMLSGGPPFSGRTPADVIAQVLTVEPPVLTGVPAPLEAIGRKALEKARDARYATAAAFRADLDAFRASEAAQAEAQTSTPAPAPAVPPRPPSRWRPVGRWALRGVAALSVLVALAAGGWWFWDWIRRPAIDSVAVLPFANLDGDADSEYLSAGLAESVRNNLSRMHGVRVAPRTSSARFSSASFDPVAAATALGVRAIVSGTVSQRNGRLQISTELMDVTQSRRLWGESYDRSAEDIVAVQADIARQAADAMKVWLTRDVVAHLGRQRAIAPQAFRLVLQADALLNLNSVESNTRAVALLNQALAVDPQYFEAWGRLAGAYNSLASSIRSAGQAQTAEESARTVALSKDYTRKSLAAARRASELDPDPAGVSTLRDQSGRLMSEWRWSEAEHVLRYLLVLSPADPGVHGMLANVLSFVGRHDEAIAESSRALDLDPLSSTAANVHAQTLLHGRRWREVVDLLERKRDTQADSVMTRVFLAEAYRQLGRFDDAEAQFDAVVGLGEPKIKESMNYLMLQASRGRRAEVERAVATALAAGDEDGIGVLHAVLGDDARALEALEKELSRRTPNMVTLTMFPELDRLLDEPRYQAILKAVGVTHPPVPAPR